MINSISKLDFTVIEVQGIDAISYLQGQLTSDIKAMQIGGHNFTAHCDHKGKMIAFYHIYIYQENCFWLICENSTAQNALNHLKKYAIFSKVTIEFKDIAVLGVVGDFTKDNFDIFLPLSEKHAFLLNENNFDSENSTFWQLQQILAGIVNFKAEDQGEFLPQALNLQYLENAISFKKGCYIGQEMIAKAQWRGANKNALFAFKTQGKLPEDLPKKLTMQVDENFKETGQVVSIVNFENEIYLQAVISKDLQNENFSFAEFKLEKISLPYVIE